MKNGVEERVDAFTRDQVRQFYVSRSDNRTVKMQMQNKRRNGYDEVRIVFQTVHKLHQFAALLSIMDDYPKYRPISPLSKAAGEESKETAVEFGVADERVLAITWNFGGSSENVFQDQMDKFLPDVADFSMVFIAGQECLANRMTGRMNQLELHLK